MKLIDYLAKCKGYKELRRQLTEVEFNKDRNIATGDIKDSGRIMKLDREYKEQINLLNEELREIFKEK